MSYGGACSAWGLSICLALVALGCGSESTDAPSANAGSGGSAAGSLIGGSATGGTADTVPDATFATDAAPDDGPGADAEPRDAAINAVDALSSDVAPPTMARGQFVWPVPAWIAATDFYYDGRTHSGSADLAVPYFTPVFAARPGKVIQSVWSDIGGYIVRVDHGDGYVTLYGHFSDKPDVSVGDTVTTGQHLGYSGRTGNAYLDGAHLHFAIERNGIRLTIPSVDFGDWVRRGDYIPGNWAPLSAIDQPNSPFDVKVVLPTLNVLASASQTAAVLGTVSGGAVLTVVGSDRGYYQVPYNATTGFIVHTGTLPARSNLFGARVAVDPANVYSGPAANSTLIGTVAQGEILTVFEEQAGFYRFLFDLPTKYRWVRRSDTEPTATFHARVRAPTANVRSDPDANSADVGTLKLMDPLTVYEIKDGWFRIIHNGQTAWMAGWLTQGRI